MFYTLSTWAIWMAGAALVGVVVGWLLRSVRPRVVTVIKEVPVDGTPRGSRRPAALVDDRTSGEALSGESTEMGDGAVSAMLLGESLPSDRTVELERARDEIDALEREVSAWQAEARRQTERAETAERDAEAAKADWEAQLASARTSDAAPVHVVAHAAVEAPDVVTLRSERDLLAGEVLTLRAAVQELRVRLWNADAQVAALRDGPSGT